MPSSRPRDSRSSIARPGSDPSPPPLTTCAGPPFCFQLGDKAVAPARNSFADSSSPQPRLDHLLIGREQLAREQYRDAIHSTQSAIRLDPDQLGAHLAPGRRVFQHQQFSESKASLNTCIRIAPELLGSVSLPRDRSLARRGIVRGRRSKSRRHVRPNGRSRRSNSSRPPGPTTARHSKCGPALTSSTSSWSIGAG